MAQNDWDAAMGPTRLLPGESRYAKTCSHHTERDLPGYVSPPPVPVLKAKTKPAPTQKKPPSRKQAQEEARILAIAKKARKADVWAAGKEDARPLSYWMEEARAGRCEEFA